MRIASGSRREIAALLILGIVAVLYACGYLVLPGGWTVNFAGFHGDPVANAVLQLQIKLPPGFSINTYAGGIDNARFLLFTEAGDLLVSAPRDGRVVLLRRDANGDGVADGQQVLLDHLYQPHGLAYRDGWLYVAETNAVGRVRFDPATGSVSGNFDRIIIGLPDDGSHWTRTVHIGPDEELYVSVGSSCNVCIESDPRRAAILRFNLDGSGGEVYANGLRNSVDFDWQPGTGNLYATDNGRDLLGDDFPPDELNRIVPGGFYGWPFANGNRVPDPDFGAGHEREIADSLPPAHAFNAHVAALGIAFYRPPADGAPHAFPARYRGAAFVAQHGSWNRSKKIGYQIVALHFGTDGSIAEEPFATGFMVNERVSARPVDVAVGPDGALYVSDDFTGSIYRIGYGPAASGVAPPPVPATAAADPLAGLALDERLQLRASGEALWNANGCAGCHLAGQAAPDRFRPLAGLRAKYTIESLAAFLHTPQPPMPVFPFDILQRRDLAVYLLDTFP